MRALATKWFAKRPWFNAGPVHRVDVPEDDARSRSLLVRFLTKRRFGLPPFAGHAAALAFLGAAGLYGAGLSGALPKLSDVATRVGDGVFATIGFSMQEVQISGLREVSEKQILAATGIRNGQSLIMLDAAQARRNLEMMSWVKSAKVMKLYPGIVQIKVVERTPFAIWQRSPKDASVIDVTGVEVSRLNDKRFMRLPRVVGAAAGKKAGAFLAILNEFPTIGARMRAASLVAERRWNLLLESGVTVRLPERNVRAAMQALVRLEQEKGLFNRDIVLIDLRLEDRLVIRLTKDAAQRRRDLVKSLQKRAKREQRI